ncbi:MAG TPA: hypothetical protein PKH75_14070 [Bacillota bacterium]|nr:hypothetical protein [Bacillota bacterium]
MHLTLHPSGEAIIVSEVVDSVFSWIFVFERESDARYIMSEAKTRAMSALVQFVAFLQKLLGPEARYTIYPLRDA